MKIKIFQDDFFQPAYFFGLQVRHIRCQQGQTMLCYYPVSDHDHDLRSRLMAKWEMYLVTVTYYSISYDFVQNATCCASCKKIRDDKGYWNQIESYIQKHSKAEFTHGICPECAKKLYPEFYSNNQK